MIPCDTLETSEGVVHFPDWTWGAGYLVDERTQAALETWRSWFRWYPLLIVLATPAGYVLHITGLEALCAALLLIIVGDYVAQRYVLRNSRKSSIRMRRDEIVRAMVAAGERASLLRWNVGFLVFYLLFIVFLACTADGLDKWFIFPAAAADIALLVDVVRIWRTEERTEPVPPT